MAFGVSRTRDFMVLLSFISVKDFFECWRVALVESRRPTCTNVLIARHKDRCGHGHSLPYATIGIEESGGDDTRLLRLGGTSRVPNLELRGENSGLT